MVVVTSTNKVFASICLFVCLSVCLSICTISYTTQNFFNEFSCDFCKDVGNLPEYLRDPELSIDNFRRQLKTFLFAQY